MGRVAVTAVALLCLSLVVFNFHGVEGRSLRVLQQWPFIRLPPCYGHPDEIPWHEGWKPGDFNCINEPDSRSAQVDKLPLCHGAPSELPGANCIIGPGPVSQVTIVENDDPDCAFVRGGFLPPLKCLGSGTFGTPLAASYATQTSPPDDTKQFFHGLAAAKVFEACKYTWQLPGTDCWTPIGESPHCKPLHDSGCEPTPPSSTTAHVTGIDGEVPVGPPPHKPTPPPCSTTVQVTSVDGEVPLRPPPKPLPPCPTTAH